MDHPVDNTEQWGHENQPNIASQGYEQGRFQYQGAGDYPGGRGWGNGGPPPPDKGKEKKNKKETNLVFGKVLLYVILSLAGITIFYGIIFNLFAGGLNALESFSSPGHSGVTRPSIGVVEIIGNIEDSKEISEIIYTYEKDPLIEGVLVRIDSPGGAVAPAQEIYQDLLRLKESKKVVVSMGSTAASGGYYIACAADSIIANPGTLTGSIGVISQTAQINTLIKNLGIETATFKSGRLKDTGSPFRPVEDGDQELLDSLVNNLFQQFIDDVQAQRELTPETVEMIGDGRVLSGKQAQELGLVDHLGNLNTAREKLVELAELKEDLPLAYPPDKTIPLLLRFILREGVSATLKGLFEQKPNLKLEYSLPSQSLGLGN